jgi:hypothetical protein
MSYRYIEAPTWYEQAPTDPPAVFLAGGISGVVNWQPDAAAALSGCRCVVLNPRRAMFDPTDQDAVAEQIKWEYHHLRLPRVLTLFWFPASDPAVTVQPIALYELGGAAERRSLDRRLMVGAHPDYPRRVDLEHQLRLACPAVYLHDDLDLLLSEVRALIDPVYALETGSY